MKAQQNRPINLINDKDEKNGKRIIKTSKMTEEDIKEFAEIEKHHRNETYESFLKNTKVKFQPVISDDSDNDDILTEDVRQIKIVLKIAVLKAGYKNIDDYANNSHLNYSAGSIKMSFSANHKTSDKILLEIAKELGVDLEIEEKKVFKIKQ